MRAHLLRDPKGLYDLEPGKQEWASQMASLLIEAGDAASAARQAGQSALDAAVLDNLVRRYRAVAAGLGLAEFALIQSYLSTAAKWGIGKLDALRDLFNGHAWLPPASNPLDKPAPPDLSHQAGDACRIATRQVPGCLDAFPYLNSPPCGV